MSVRATVIFVGRQQPYSQAFRPLTSPMEHPQNDNRVIHHTIRSDIGRANYHQFPRLEYSSRAAKAGLFCQQPNRLQDTLGYLSCGFRVHRSDVLSYRLQILASPAMPGYLHEGGSASLSAPQRSSHWTTAA